MEVLLIPPNVLRLNKIKAGMDAETVCVCMCVFAPIEGERECSQLVSHDPSMATLGAGGSLQVMVALPKHCGSLMYVLSTGS